MILYEFQSSKLFQFILIRISFWHLHDIFWVCEHWWFEAVFSFRSVDWCVISLGAHTPYWCPRDVAWRWGSGHGELWQDCSFTAWYIYNGFTFPRHRELPPTRFRQTTCPVLLQSKTGMVEFQLLLWTKPWDPSLKVNSYPLLNDSYFDCISFETGKQLHKHFCNFHNVLSTVLSSSGLSGAWKFCIFKRNLFLECSAYKFYATDKAVIWRITKWGLSLEEKLSDALVNPFTRWVCKV